MKSANRTQFEILTELAALFREHRVVFWLRGGWALDFRVGTITRSHSDIDLVTWSRNAARVRRLLEAHGYRLETVTARAAVHFSKRGQDVGIAFIKREPAGLIVTPGREFWPWPHDAFPYRWLQLRGVECRAMSLASLLEEKEYYQQHTRRPPRPKDRDSIELLRSLIATNAWPD